MAGSRRQRAAEFDVTEFLRPNDADMKGAITSILRDPPPPPDSGVYAEEAGVESGAAPPPDRGPDGAPAQPESVPFPAFQPHSSAGVVEIARESVPESVRLGRPRVGANTQPKGQRRGISPVDRSFDLSFYLARAKTSFRLNRTESKLYETFLKWTHAVGVTTCRATNGEICEASGVEIKTARRNLKSLRMRGLINQLSAYDPHSHEPALYEVFLPIIIRDDPDK